MITLKNILSSGYTFAPDEYEMENKYILANALLLVLSFILALSPNLPLSRNGLVRNLVFKLRQVLPKEMIKNIYGGGYMFCIEESN